MVKTKKEHVSQHVIHSFIYLLVLLNLCSMVSFATAQSLKINVSNATISTGQTYKLTAITTPKNISVSWSSSDENVAVISQDGTVRGKQAGKTTITCKTRDGSNLSATCQVTVFQNITSISVSPSKITIPTGTSRKLDVSVSPSNAANKNLSWKSSKTQVATVSNGVVKGMSPGTAVITCMSTDDSHKSASCTVIVEQGVSSIALNKTSVTLTQGNFAQLVATISPANATNKNLSWTSNNAAVASVNSSGKITAKKEGSAVITCKSNDGTNKQASCSVTVVSSTTKPVEEKPKPTKPIKPEKPKPTNPPSSTKTEPIEMENMISSTQSLETTWTENTENTENIENTESVTSEQTEEVEKTEQEEQKEKENELNLKLFLQTKDKKDIKKGLHLNWNTYIGEEQIDGYDVFAFAENTCKKTEDFNKLVSTKTLEDYSLICTTKNNSFIISNFNPKTNYAFVVCAYKQENESEEKEYVAVAKVATIQTKRTPLREWFAKYKRK